MNTNIAIWLVAIRLRMRDTGTNEAQRDLLRGMYVELLRRAQRQIVP